MSQALCRTRPVLTDGYGPQDDVAARIFPWRPACQLIVGAIPQSYQNFFSTVRPMVRGWAMIAWRFVTLVVLKLEQVVTELQ